MGIVGIRKRRSTRTCSGGGRAGTVRVGAGTVGGVDVMRDSCSTTDAKSGIKLVRRR